MSAWTDFRDGIENKVQASVVTSDASQPPTGGGIFDAIYAYGRGQFDTATQKLTQAFRASPTGRKIEAEATNQKISELMPYIILRIHAIVAGTYFLSRR